MGSILKQLFSRDRHSHYPKYWQQSKQSFFFFFFFFRKGWGNKLFFKKSRQNFIFRYLSQTSITIRKKIFFKKSRQNYTYIFKCLSQTSIANKSAQLFCFSEAKLLSFLQIVLCPLQISLYGQKLLLAW